MTNFNFNGLTNDFLPNVYINKITLEGKDSGFSAISENYEEAIDAHIQTPQTWNTIKPDAQTLKITYDLFVEILEVGDSNVGMYLDDIFKYINVNVLTFKGNKGKKAYKHFTNIENTNDFGTIDLSEMIRDYLSKNPTSWPAALPLAMASGTDFKFSLTKINDYVQSKLHNMDASSDDPKAQAKAQKNKIEFFKQKYRHMMPDGRIIYKLPVRVIQELPGEMFPNDLAAIVTCTLDISSMVEAFADIQVTFNPYQASGRITSEVIISGGKTPEKGMIFFISTDQAPPGSTVDEAEKLNKKFSNIIGQLWLGGVHKQGNRFMAGNKHNSSISHPYLDFVFVDNKRVHDYRQISSIKKKMWGLASEGNDSIFGGNYINLQSEVKTANLSELSCFSQLFSTVDIGRRVKLFFCVDWGKLLKKRCTVPRLLDSLSTSGALNSFFNTYGFPNILSFKIYRKRLNASHDISHQSKEHLIYDGYPHIFYATPEEKQKENPTPLSALSTVNIDYGGLIGWVPPGGPSEGVYGTNNFLKHYTFTDYDIGNTSKGVFKYSVEIEIADPTLDYFLSHYNEISDGLTALKPYVALANGNYASTISNKPITFFDSYTGLFNDAFKNNDIAQWYKIEVPDKVKGAFLQAKNILSIMQVNKSLQDAAPKSPINFLDENQYSSLLLVDTATPDSINAAYSVLDTIKGKLKSFIDSFSSAKMPKDSVSACYSKRSNT